MTMEKQSGFTALELIVVIIIFVSVGSIFWFQMRDIEAQHRDIERKTAINSMYYNLEEIVYKELGGYPSTLNATQLKAMDSSLLKDTNGVTISDSGSQYRYEPSSCNGAICQHYILRATLEKEAEYVKESRN